jgi:hypothetical protein
MGWALVGRHVQVQHKALLTAAVGWTHTQTNTPPEQIAIEEASPWATQGKEESNYIYY